MKRVGTERRGTGAGVEKERKCGDLSRCDVG